MGWFDSLKRERKEAQAVTEVKEPIIESVPAVDNKEEAVVFDNYRHLRPSDKKIAADLISQLLKNNPDNSTRS